MDRVRNAICAAGAGHIGQYRDCTFGAHGTATFRPLAGTTPFIGSRVSLEHVREIRLERLSHGHN